MEKRVRSGRGEGSGKSIEEIHLVIWLGVGGVMSSSATLGWLGSGEGWRNVGRSKRLKDGKRGREEEVGR